MVEPGRKEIVIATVTLLTALLAPAAARAQPPASPARVSIGGGAGVGVPLHGDFDFVAPAWETDVRVALSRHALFEVAAGDWRHSQTRVQDRVIVTGPGSEIGRLEQTTTHRQRSVQANLLFAGRAGRVQIATGGGVGVLLYRRETETVTSDCSAGVTCGQFESRFTNTSVTVQATGGADVLVTRRIAVYGQGRLIVPLRDAGGSDVRVTAGIRLGF